MAHARNGENQFWGDKILVYFNDSNEIELISIIDNVKIRNNEEEITGDFAEYTLKLEEIKVTGNVILTKGSSILTGDELIVDLLNSTSIIKSSNNNQVSAKIIK
jgi:lipopolysaccharide export system protein LptA